MKIPRGVTALLALVCLAACESVTGVADLELLPSPPTDLETARAHWETHGLDHYRFDTERLCFCLPAFVEPVRVTVQNGWVTSVRSRRTWKLLPLPEEPGGIPRYTIEDLFDKIQDAKDSGEFLSVEYDPRGYPADLIIGTLINDAGDWYVVSNVRRIE